MITKINPRVWLDSWQGIFSLKLSLWLPSQYVLYRTEVYTQDFVLENCTKKSKPRPLYLGQVWICPQEPVPRAGRRRGRRRGCPQRWRTDAPPPSAGTAGSHPPEHSAPGPGVHKKVFFAKKYCSIWQKNFRKICGRKNGRISFKIFSKSIFWWSFAWKRQFLIVS